MIVELPIFLIDKKLDDLGVDSEDIPCKLSVRTEHIIAYREAFKENPKGEEKLENIMIYLSNGQSFLVDIAYSKFKSKYMEE